VQCILNNFTGFDIIKAYFPESQDMSTQLQRGSLKSQQISESVFREVSRLAHLHKAINLGPGLPDSLIPPELIEAGIHSLNNNIHQYAIIFGDRMLRESIADKEMRLKGRKIDPETQITVTCGATEAIYASMLAHLNPGDEVIVFEPFYESYGPNTILCDAKPVYVSLHPPEWRFDEGELTKAFSNRTKAIILNTPQNPSGTVFTKEETQTIAKLCQKYGVLAITDEIYEHITYDGIEHFSISSIPGMEELSITCHSLSKTFSVTGWRIGWAITSPSLTTPIRKVHDFVTAGTAAPLQRAAAAAVSLGEDYYKSLAPQYENRRNHLLETLDMAEIPYAKPQGAYYLLADISKFGFEDDMAFTKNLIEKVGVAAVPGSTFFRPTSTSGKDYIRVCFSRQLDVLEEARTRLTSGDLYCR
jgi:aspartate/methionine/tyrosine aminotransferase